ncbi:hypothetical protein EAH87_04675 [Sphingomonas koreensis]|nr:hypothetical protein EAH87_04675 [Sphingomonas koreensis]
MKKFLLSAVAATLVASPILAAAPASAAQRYSHQMARPTHVAQRTTYRAQPRVNYTQNYRQWNRGDRFDSRYASNYRTVSNYRDYQLQAPPSGYQWEQSGNDAVLVALAGGLIGAVIGGAFN